MKEQQRKFDEELKAKVAEGEKTIDEALDLDATMAEMEDAYKEASGSYRSAVLRLTAASVALYGLVACQGLAMLWAGRSIYGIIPLITLATLILVPLYLWVHSVGKDKDRALALREDIRSKQALVLLVKYYNREGNNEALLRLFDHHAHSSTPALILGGSKEQPAGVVRAVTNVFDRDKGDKTDK